MASIKLKLYWQFEDMGEEAPMEIQNDSKFALILLNSFDTGKEKDRGKRRTISRLGKSLRPLTRRLSKMRLPTNEDMDEDGCWSREDEIEVSPEAMEFLYEMSKEAPEGVTYRTTPIQELLISIEDQYDEWNKKEGGKKDKEKDEKAPEDVPAPSKA